MNTKLITLAAAAMISVGAFAAAPAAAAPVGAKAPAVESGNGNVEAAYYGGGYGYRHRRMCRRLYISGFYHGNWRARRAYYRLCTNGRGHGRGGRNGRGRW
jgi:hypothetical protein